MPQLFPVVLQDGTLRRELLSALAVFQLQNLVLELGDFLNQSFVCLVDLLILALLVVVVLFKLVPLLAELRYLVAVGVDNLGVVSLEAAAAVDPLK